MDVNIGGARKKERSKAGAGNYMKRNKFIYVSDGIEKCRSWRKIEVPERKMSEKNQKYSGFRPYIRKLGSAYDSSFGNST